jgi:hypothetical protein
MVRSSVVLISLARASIAGFTRFRTRPRAPRGGLFCAGRAAMAKHGIRAWRSWIEGPNEMTFTRDTIVGRNRDGSIRHHGAPMRLDAAPTGSTVGGIGEESMGYRENNRTNRPIAGTEARRSDGAIRGVLACWGADRETEIVEESGLKYLLMWTPLQPGEGAPENAIMTNAIGRTSVSGPEATRDAHRQMFDRLKDHDSRKPSVARKALASIKKNTDTMESINAANAKFWGGNK